ncbi:polysaccharide pyruvyl transferase family protein [Marisediminicola sp. LYQ134]|uniref:polysaccharide pyruvyl transferase family protein n=1 Tax=unclassified Marisediminicola TaxID=2618316 RepID=UPI0039836916
MRSPHISIIGSAFSGNKGASAMLESAITTLRARIPGVTFTLFSMYPSEDAALNDHADVEIIDARPRQLGVNINTLALAYRVLRPARSILRSRSRAVAALAKSDVLLDQGGITFADGREKFLLYNVASILPALNIGTAVFKCAQAVGPFMSPVNRIAAKTFLPKVATIVTRGRITHDFARGLGLTNIHAGADYAFSLELDGTEHDVASSVLDTAFFDEGRVVGISPSVVVQKKVDAAGAAGDYSAHVVALINHLTARGLKVFLVPHSVRTGTDATHNNDLPLCRDLFARIDHRDRVLFADTELPSQVLRYLIGRCDFFIASRFHAMVSSLAMKVPTLVIGWSHKYREVLEMFDLEEWAMGFATASADAMIARFRELEAAEDSVRAKLEEHLPAVKALSVQQADLIAELVLSKR